MGLHIDDKLFGARIDEVITLINHVVQNGERLAQPNMLDVYESEVAGGIVLRVRQQFHEKGLTRVSLSGKGWMLSLTVTKKRPRNLEDSVPSVLHDMFVFNRDTGRGLTLKSLTFFNPSFLSPDEFRKEMTLLRMFNSEWAI